eukprot:gene12765-8704_t
MNQRKIYESVLLHHTHPPFSSLLRCVEGCVCVWGGVHPFGHTFIYAERTRCRLPAPGEEADRGPSLRTSYAPLF